MKIKEAIEKVIIEAEWKATEHLNDYCLKNDELNILAKKKGTDWQFIIKGSSGSKSIMNRDLSNLMEHKHGKKINKYITDYVKSIEIRDSEIDREFIEKVKNIDNWSVK